MTKELIEWPDWLPGYPSRPDHDHAPQRHPPRGVVVHSGESGPDLADAALRMSISYHFAWDTERGSPGRFVQLVSLQRRAYHAGREGNDWVGIALSGPWDQNPRTDNERDAFLALVCASQAAFGGTLEGWCRHSDITPGKRDPGPGVDVTWEAGLAALGLRWVKRGPRGLG